MNDLIRSLSVACDDGSKPAPTLSASSLGSLSSLPPELRLMIYKFSYGDIYTDELFNSPDDKIASTHMKECDCCKKLIQNEGDKHQNFVDDLVNTRQTARLEAFKIYFNLTLVNKMMCFEARDGIRKHYQSQLHEKSQVYYICRIASPRSCLECATPKYVLASQDLWSAQCSTPTQLAALRLPKLTLAFCHGGLSSAIGNALEATQATKCLNIHIEDTVTRGDEEDFFDEKFAWAKHVGDMMICGRCRDVSWEFRADSNLSRIESNRDHVPLILDPAFKGRLTHKPYERNEYLVWRKWVVEEAQEVYSRRQSSIEKRLCSILDLKAKKAEESPAEWIARIENSVQS